MNAIYELSKFFNDATIIEKTAVLLEIHKREPIFLLDVIKSVAGEFVDAHWKSEAKDLLFCGKKISAIKICRAHTGWPLKDAKNAVEDLQKKLGL